MARRLNGCALLLAAAAFMCSWVAAVPARAAAPAHYLGEWGSAGTGPGQFNHPAGVAIDASGNVYVADQGNDRVQQFAPDGSFLRSLGGSGELAEPTGVAVATDGRLFVRSRRYTVAYDATGMLLTDPDPDPDPMFTAMAPRTGDSSPFLGLGADSAGNRYEPDVRREPVSSDEIPPSLYKFDSEGNEVASFQQRLRKPAGLSLDSSGYVYVVDAGAGVVEKFTSYLALVGEWGQAVALSGPTAVTLCGDGDNFVTDTKNNQVRVFSPSGLSRGEFGSAGGGAGAFSQPTGIAADCRTGFPPVLYVADAGNNRIERFAIDLAPPPSGSPTLPPPVLGQSANTAPLTGVVTIQLPDSSEIARLDQKGQIPTGSTVDATHGRIRLTLAAAGAGPRQQGDFRGSSFVIEQARHTGVTTLTLSKPARCRRQRDGSVRTLQARRLFGHAHGHFQTRGRHSSATVRGTRWLTQETCVGTLTVVESGVVRVRDFGLRKNITLRGGQRYLARRGNR